MAVSSPRAQLQLFQEEATSSPQSNMQEATALYLDFFCLAPDRPMSTADRIPRTQKRQSV